VTITVTPLATYRNDSPYPFCPGCGHSSILDRLDQALVRLQVDPRSVVLVTDIGCPGLSDQYFATNAFHGLHGRSITYATGIKLAKPDLTVIVIMGDGGTGIGGAHLLSAARRNIGITVLVLNNLNFGMTGGQHSTTTPEGAVTSTTPGGNLERPLDICATVGVNGAAYAWRGTSFDTDLAERIAEGINEPGFALLDIWELCTAYFVRSNRFSRRAINTAMEELGFARGLLFRRPVDEYAQRYRAAHAGDTATPSQGRRPIPIEFEHRLTTPIELMVAGSAGAKVRSAARLFGEAAIRSGLWVTQRDDYPITVRSGHSISTLTLALEETPVVGAGVPDVLVILSEEGLAKARPTLQQMTATTVVVATPGLVAEPAAARVDVVDPVEDGARVGKAQRALAVLAATLGRLELFPGEALRRAATDGPFAEQNLAAIDAGWAATSTIG
jgi:pyruvate/2-oxoacid:ferredoxin oxidoreductase beta subunit/Pyruvate/2-oxoacid:ferredoxin oxidoreductase gamma subunit